MSVKYIFDGILALAYDDIVRKSGRTNRRSFFSAGATLSRKIWILFKSYLQHLPIKFSGYPFSLKCFI